MALAPIQPYVGNNAATQIFGSQYGSKPAPSMGTTVTPPAPQTTNQKVAAQKPLVRTLQPNLATNAGAVAALKQQTPTTAASFGTSQAPATNPLAQLQNVQPGSQPPAQTPAPVGSNNVPAPAAQAQGTPFTQQVGAEQAAGAGSTATTQRITDLGAQIAQAQQDEAQQLAALGMGGGDLGPTTGEQAAVQANYAARIASLTQEQQTQQAQQTAQFGQQTAAAQQLQPQVVGTGQAVFNPTQQPTGGITGGNSGLNPVAGLTQPQGGTSPDVSQILANPGLYSQIVQDGSAVPGFKNALDQQLQAASPGFNPNVAVGTGAGQQQSATILGTANAQASATNTQTALTTAQSAAAAAYSAGYPQYTNLTQNVLPNIADFGTLLTQAAGGVNPFSSTWANQTWGSFQKALLSGSDGAAQWSKFQSTFQQLQNSIAQLAQAGGAQTPTANTAQSQLTLDPNASISTIQNVLSRVQQEAAIYGTNMANAVNANLAQAQGGTPTSIGAGGSAQGFTYNVPGGGTITQGADGKYSYSQ